MTQTPFTPCETVHALLASADDDLGLTSHERRLVDDHLAGCSACHQDEALRRRAVKGLAALSTPTPDPVRRDVLRRAVASRSQRGSLSGWLTAPIPAYGAVAAALVVFALAGALGENRDIPVDAKLAAVADTSLPAPVLTRADSYNVLANIRLLDRSLNAVPLLTDTLHRAALPGTEL
ncbi:MAG: hypothetical protein QF689_00700 [Candidatus Latescibacteria bacterium]|jgi:anti-sigma factor RsiW|nr:hypothetical protein [Candidatus Latescibacterota bacterium]MDP7447079.1 hypothetical protein [Candidatus Latescibacterota bacterium]HJP32796.1 hypothetical protein [Candidatus Latescibacterota bacterium]